MRKYVALVACVLLIAISAVLSIGTPGVHFGRGDGVDMQLESLQDVADAFEALYGISLFTTGEGEKEYKSATFELTLEDTISMEYSGVSIDMDIVAHDYYCITEEARYYKSYGDIYMNMGEGIIDIDFDVETYISEDQLLVKYNKFNMSASGFAFSGKSFTQKWYDLNSDEGGMEGFSEILSMADTQTMDVLGLFGSYITEYKDYAFTVPAGDRIYTLDTNKANQLWMDIYELNDMGEDASFLFQNEHTSSFTVNLNVWEAPVMSFSASASGSIDNGGQSMTYSIDYVDSITMKYVNNTVVNFPDVTVYSLTDFVNNLGKDFGVMM